MVSKKSQKRKVVSRKTTKKRPLMKKKTSRKMSKKRRVVKKKRSSRKKSKKHRVVKKKRSSHKMSKKVIMRGGVEPESESRPSYRPIYVKENITFKIPRNFNSRFKNYKLHYIMEENEIQDTIEKFEFGPNDIILYFYTHLGIGKYAIFKENKLTLQEFKGEDAEDVINTTKATKLILQPYFDTKPNYNHPLQIITHISLSRQRVITEKPSNQDDEEEEV
jgi:hypothetical protein